MLRVPIKHKNTLRSIGWFNPFTTEAYTFRYRFMSDMIAGGHGSETVNVQYLNFKLYMLQAFIY